MVVNLKQIDLQFKSVTDEYAQIHDSINTLSGHVNAIRERQGETPETVRKVLREEAASLQNRWLIGAISLLLGFIGLGLSVSSNPALWQHLKDYGVLVGIGFIAIAAIVLAIMSRTK